MQIGQEPGLTSSASECSISFQEVERVAALAVELVDKGDDRHVAQPADLEELPGLLLDAPFAPLGASSSGPLPNPPPRAGEGRVGGTAVWVR
jgi:hypothetical protein